MAHQTVQRFGSSKVGSSVRMTAASVSMDDAGERYIRCVVVRHSVAVMSPNASASESA